MTNQGKLVCAGLIGLGIWIVGDVHIVYGSRVETTVCAKSSWSFTDTLVDTDAYERMSLGEKLEHAHAIQDIVTCKVPMKN